MFTARTALIAAALTVGLACDAISAPDYGFDTADPDFRPNPADLPGNDVDTDADLTQPGAALPPRANAGPDISGVNDGDLIQLDGSGSGPTSEDLQFQWSFLARPAGSVAELQNPTFDQTQFVADRAGEYRVKLTVSYTPEGSATSLADEDTVRITVSSSNRPPEARVVANPSSGDVGQLFVFDGSSSSDPDGDPLCYYWQITARPSGSVAQLSGGAIPAQASQVQLQADRGGSYTVQLIVRDKLGNTCEDYGSESRPAFATVSVRQPTSSGGSSSGGSSGSSGDCLSCTEPAAQAFRAGDAAGSAVIGSLPLLLLLWHRRREDD